MRCDKQYLLMSDDEIAAAMGGGTFSTEEEGEKALRDDRTGKRHLVQLVGTVWIEITKSYEKATP